MSLEMKSLPKICVHPVDAIMASTEVSNEFAGSRGIDNLHVCVVSEIYFRVNTSYWKRSCGRRAWYTYRKQAHNLCIQFYSRVSVMTTVWIPLSEQIRAR